MASVVEPDPAPGILARSRDAAAVAELAAALAVTEGVRSCAWHEGDGIATLRVTGDADLLAERAQSLPDTVWYRTTSRRLRRHRVTWDLGEPTPGVGIIFDIHRNRALDHRAFDEHWRDVHGPLALAHHIGMWDYEQVTVVGGEAKDLDGFAVVQFPTTEDASERFFDTSDGAAAVSADAAAFTDAATLSRMATTERVLLEPPPPEVGSLDWADHRCLRIGDPVTEVWPVVARRAGDPAAVRHHRPGERMLELDIPTTSADVLGATSRWEVREAGSGTRVDWSVRALVRAGAEAAFAALAEGLWAGVRVDLGFDDP